MREEKSIFRRALEISVLLHLLLVFLVLPRMKDVWPEARAPIFAMTPEIGAEETAPLEFEFVDLPNDREETPVSDDVPLSDLDRRAHGGEGETDARPSSQGNTPQLVQADGGTRFDRGLPPQHQGPPTERIPPADAEERPEKIPDERPLIEDVPKGAGEDQEQSAKPQAVRLPPPGAWVAPPERGGLPENPDRGGGRVDAGGLSFDTQWYDWGPYAKMMLAKIRRNWRIPEIAQMGVTGVVRIRFHIERDGEVTGLTILDESGRPPMDNAARNAIAHSSNFEPLPADLTGVIREGVTITFYYNLNPPDRRRR